MFNTTQFCPPGSPSPQTIPPGFYLSKAIEALGFDLNLQLCPPGSYCIHGDKLMTTTDDPDTLMKVKSLRVLWAATAMSLVSRSQHALEFALKATTAQLEQSIP
ncbi:unnamed protein product [Aphanomyces euteiches]